MANPSKVQKTALAITSWIGSPQSIILHTILFAAAFLTPFFGLIAFDRMLLVLTTILSLEAIYLSLFIQMTVNYTTVSLESVEKDIDEIQVDIGEMQEDVEEIAEDVDELQEDVEEIAEDVEEISEDVEEMSEDVEEMSEEDKQEVARDALHDKALSTIQSDLQKLMQDIENLKK